MQRSQPIHACQPFHSIQACTCAPCSRANRRAAARRVREIVVVNVRPFGEDQGRESLAVLYPMEAPKVRLINGDTVTPTKFTACLDEVRETLAGVEGRLGKIEERLARIEGLPQRWLVVGVVLVALLIVARVGTPFLNAALIHR